MDATGGQADRRTTVSRSEGIILLWQMGIRPGNDGIAWTLYLEQLTTLCGVDFTTKGFSRWAVRKAIGELRSEGRLTNKYDLGWLQALKDAFIRGDGTAEDPWGVTIDGGEF
jgi:hypothetical protein